MKIKTIKNTPTHTQKQGYKTDIRMLRTRLKELERQLYKLTLHMGEQQPSDVQVRV